MTISAVRIASLLGDEPMRSPAYRDLAERLRVLIIDGRVPDGVRLPSERELATAVDVSRTTTTRAYAELRDAGLVVSRQGSGTVVRVPFKVSDVTSMVFNPTSPDDIGLMCAASPAPPGLASAFATAAERLPGLLATNGYFPEGLPDLRRALAQRYTDSGLPTGPDQIIVTSGAMGAINLTAQTFLRPGSRVVVESLSFPHAYDALRRAGGRLSPLPHTQHPWDPDSLHAVLQRSPHDAAYFIPDFHNPTGAVMPADVRERWAFELKRQDVLPLADETLRELNLDGVSLPPSFASFDDRTILFGSASKLFWGGLRIGWARVPQERLRALLQTRVGVDLGSSAFEQLVAAELITNGAAVEHEHRNELRANRNHLLTELATRLPDFRVSPPPGGMNLWVTLPERVSTSLVGRASRLGLWLTPGPRFFAKGGGEANLRLPFTSSPTVLSDSVGRLADAYATLNSNEAPQRDNPPLDLIA